MILHKIIPRMLPASSLALVAALSLAQAQLAPEYEPNIGQEGKDVVWVPTSQALVDRMLDMANVTAKDFVIDLGSGDGRTVITAAKRGAKAMGIEYNPDMVELSKRNAAKEGLADKVTFVKADIFKSDFSKATVLTLFLLPDLNVRLRPKILNMKPGVRVVSNSFDMDDWMPEDQVKVDDGCLRFCTALFWIVPAKVQGKWKMPRGEFVLNQKYQMLSGTMKVENVSAAIDGGKLTGDQIAFTAGDTSYTGRVNGNTIIGISKSPTGETNWRAWRVN
jgi:SAM-dependent methyltransferase